MDLGLGGVYGHFLGNGHGGHHESRTGAEGCIGVGGADLLVWCLPVDDVSVVERMAMAAEPAGIRADDPWVMVKFGFTQSRFSIPSVA